MSAWDDLEEPWREAFTLAWEAYGAGSIPVGAVVTRDGGIVVRGRNYMFEDEAPPGQLARSRVAHAELNVLAQLGLGERFDDAVLWTTLEPCAMCIGAAWLSTIGAVRYAGDDVYAGASRLIEAQLERSDRGRRFPLAVEGPLDGPFGIFGELLHIDRFVHSLPDRPITQAFRERRPDLVALAERLRLDEHAGAPLEEVLLRFFDAL
jgi:tRNA(Arg) A34 adenosine deaminase TadA